MVTQSRVSQQMPMTMEGLGHMIMALDIKFTQRFDAMDKRLERMDQRLNAMDKRFDGMDSKFVTIDRQFAAVIQRFDDIDERFDLIDRQYEAIDTRFVTVERKICKEINQLAQMTARGFMNIPVQVAGGRLDETVSGLMALRDASSTNRFRIKNTNRDGEAEKTTKQAKCSSWRDFCR